MKSGRCGRALLLSAAAVAYTLVFVAATRAQVHVEGIAAVVGARAPGEGADVILRSDVDLRARMHMAGRDPERPLDQLPSPGLLQAVLEELIGEYLLAREALRLRLTPGRAAVARERAQLQALAGGAERLDHLLAMFHASRSEIEQAAMRRARVQTFLAANLEGVAEITDGELQSAYDAGGHPFAGRPLEEVRDVLRAWLARRAVQQSVRRWVSVLRSRTPVRIYASSIGDAAHGDDAFRERDE